MVAQMKPPNDEQLRGKVRAIVQRLETEAENRVSKRSTIEQRWLDDLRQFNGQYDDKLRRELVEAKKSSVFVNKTRTKTNAGEAKLSDMLFPTDDRNWGIRPTPVPRLEKQAQEAVKLAKTAVDQANQTLQQGNELAAKTIANTAQGFASKAEELKAEMDEAKKRADAMADEIDDQLTECAYAIQARDAIQDACRLGTGIMKGPVAANDRVRRRWSEQQDETGAKVYTLDMAEDSRPAYYRVDPWTFFPESDARTQMESEGNYERHLYTRKELRVLARQPGFDKDAIRRLLIQEPMKPLPTYLTDLRNINNENTTPNDKRYIVWEYRGQLTPQEMTDLCTCMDKPDMMPAEEADPLQEISVVLWFCQGEPLKFGINHLDSGESIYSVYNLEKDDSSIWGKGFPALMRDSQASINGAWRMVMDNGGLSSGPQIEVDRSVGEPADGKWDLYSRKMWLKRPDAQVGKPVITVHNIESHLAELVKIIELANIFIDDETQISVLAQGEQGAHTTQTAGGMALLMNAVNVVFRRMVKNFDDDMTIPNIRRLYDWNMQFSNKDHIKGDFEVDARGTSVLLVREIQAQNLLALLQYTGHPVIGMLIKALPIVRKLVQSMMIPADDVVKTDEEVRAQAEAEAANPPPPSDEMQIAKLEANTRLQVASLERETKLMELAEKMNMDADKLRTMLQLKQVETQSKERIFAGEAALEQRAASAARAAGVQPKGSGGYISAGSVAGPEKAAQ